MFVYQAMSSHVVAIRPDHPAVQPARAALDRHEPNPQPRSEEENHASTPRHDH